MAYIPNPNDPSQPQDNVDASTAAAEFRALKGLVQTLIAGPGIGKGIYGLTYANGTDATNDLNINVGGAMDATNAVLMVLGTALGKQSDVVWAEGGTTTVPLGMLDTGAVGNSDYYLWLIKNPTSGVVDALCSLSSTAPTMPTGYVYKRLIGWFRRTGGTIVAFTTYETEGGGLELDWNAPTIDIGLVNTLTTARHLDSVKAPQNLSVIAKLSLTAQDASNNGGVLVCCPDETDAAPHTDGNAPCCNVTITTSVANVTEISIRTSAIGQIASRATFATVDSYYVSTVGFRWARRN